ncbi:MAG: cytochrome c1 [Betaproteobacteria bacterium]|nr:cytochrome c1 [Betaproteobacteria bacterium]MDH3435566.1 cytochrome c1 [Betaproteobacteria bacterium]
MGRGRQLLVALLAAPALALAAGDEVPLDRAPIDEYDLISLQRGARVYVNYCLGCHSASYMRYNRLEDLGLTAQQIRDNLIFAGAKVGDLMKNNMNPNDAKEWFGAVPPDLTVIARSRASPAGSGADWLYTYLRSFYRDPARPTGWNNVVYRDVGMPHVLWQLQGEQELRTEVVTIPRGNDEEDVEKREVQKLVFARPGSLNPLEYDRLVGDLVNFLAYMAEPVKRTRIEIGFYVLLFLAILFVLAYALKKEYWKAVH